MLDNKDRKMLFFDIDGTLITEDGNHTLPDSAVQAIRQARANGHLVFINTGRVMSNVNEYIREIGFDGYVCGCGTYVVADGEILMYHQTSAQRCKEIAYACRRCELMTIFEHSEHTCVDPLTPGEKHLQVLESFKWDGKKVVDDIDSPEFVFDKWTAWYHEGNDKLEEFKAFVAEDFTWIQREGSFIEFIPKGFSKATGIEVLMKHYQVPIENVYVFGDSNNDLDMLRYVPNSIAMGVCSKEVAQVASYRTDEVLEHGIYNAMKHFHII